MRTILVMLVWAVSLAGCSRDTPTGPTLPAAAPPPSNLPAVSAVLSLSLIGDEWIATNVGAPVQHAARLVTSTTPFEYTLATDGVEWSITPASVARVDAAGRVSPLSIGTATITARYGDKIASREIRVLPDFSGTWSGQFRITGCTGGFDFRECGRMMSGAGAGTGTGMASTPFYAFSLTLTQVRDQVTGTVREPRPVSELLYPVTGFVRVNGQLVLETTAPKDGEPLRVFNWSSTTDNRVTTMAGGFTKIEPYRTFSGATYTIRTEHEFANLARTP